jgi:hypothetical protein
MNIDCEYCGSVFSCKTSLKEHLRTSKYCSTLRSEPIVTHICEDCEKEFTTNSSLKRHRKLCIAVALKENEILKMELAIARKKEEDKDAQIRRLKKKLKAAKLTSQIPKPDPYPQKYAAKFGKIKSDPSFFCTTANVAAELNKGLFSMGDGVDGLIAFIIPFISKGELRCYVRNDRTRDSFYRYENGMWIKDACCRFIREILNAMKPFVDAWWVEYLGKMSSPNREEAQIASDVYYRDYMAFHHGIIHPNGKERDVLLKEIVEKTSHLTNI